MYIIYLSYNISYYFQDPTEQTMTYFKQVDFFYSKKNRSDIKIIVSIFFKWIIVLEIRQAAKSKFIPNTLSLNKNTFPDIIFPLQLCFVCLMLSLNLNTTRGTDHFPAEKKNKDAEAEG